MSKQTKTAKTRTACECSKFVAYNIERDVEFTTCCTATTVNTFAPGHDAKLKGNLIRWAILGYEIRKGDVTKSAEGWAEDYGFGYMVKSGIRRRNARAAEKARKSTAKLLAQPAPKTVSAKVGRWVYQGTVADGVFTYLDKKLNVQRTEKFTLV